MSNGVVLYKKWFLVELRGRQWENGWRLGVDQMKVGYRVKKNPTEVQSVILAEIVVH